MIVDKQELLLVLNEFNPWWRDLRFPEIPKWCRAAFAELKEWVVDPPDLRAILLTGARQVGKTTLFFQLIEYLLENGVKPGNILYATFDHPFLKQLGLEKLMRIWEEIQPATGELEYLFLDEIQNADHWQVWLKHQVDFKKSQRRIAVTGSAVPLRKADTESGVGRWHTIKIPTLSFYEYLQIKEQGFPKVPGLKSLQKLFSLNEGELFRIREDCRPLVPHFHEYLLRGGFPRTSLAESVAAAQKLLREDIVDKVLKRDITVLYGVRNILDLENTLHYLCMHDGGIVNTSKLSRNLEIDRQTVSRFIDLIEASNFLYKLHAFSYGKEILRGRYKLFLADPAISGSVRLRGSSLIQVDQELGAAVESAFFKHLFVRYYQEVIDFSFWRDRKGNEVDIIARLKGQVIPFEVKYRSAGVSARDLKGLKEFCLKYPVDRAYVITRNVEDFGPIDVGDTKTMRIPAPLACYWLSESESEW